MITVVSTACFQKFTSSWVVSTQVTNISLIMTLISLSPKESPGLHDLRNFLLFLTSAETSQRTLYLTIGFEHDKTRGCFRPVLFIERLAIST